MKAHKLVSVIRMALVVGAGASIGCGDTVSASDAAAGDVSDAVSREDAVELVDARDAPNAPRDVSVDQPTDAADVLSDAPPDTCGMCGCDFTGRLEGTGPSRRRTASAPPNSTADRRPTP